VCAWFGLGIHESHEVSLATGILSAPQQPSRAELARAAAALSSAGLLNPDREIDVLKGRVAVKRGQVPLARSILRAVTRAEPQNLDAWIWFTGASLGDHADTQLGAGRIAQLDPLDAKAVGR
jgi:hypothetical protein